MYLTTHAAVGVLISQSVSTPLAAFGLSFASHFVLDVIPHGDENVETWAREKGKRALLVATVDVGLLAAFVLSLYATNNLPKIAVTQAGIFGAVVPDLIAIVFPVIHQYTNWFFLVRATDRIQHWLQLHHLWHGHNALHHFTHRLIHKHISLRKGIAMQMIIVIMALVLAAQLY